MSCMIPIINLHKKWSIIPNKNDQRFVSECILRIINHKIKDDDKINIVKIINKLEKDGARGIILGCTDLPILLSNQRLNIPVINTMEILEDAAVNYLMNKI